MSHMLFPGLRLSQWEGYPHVLQTQQFSRIVLDALFGFVDHLIAERQRHDDMWVKGVGERRALLSLFYEGSSRTVSSFLRAAMNLGMRTIDVRDPEHTSSEVKGESFPDSIRTYAGGNDHGYRTADVIVLRHPEQHRVFEAAEISLVPVVNAGNGPDQHPTQSLVDLYAVRRELQRLDDLHVGIVGDLQHGRTARSLAYLLGKVGQQIRFTFIAHPELQMSPDVCEYLTRHQVPFTQRADYSDVLPTLDLLYVVRLQRERNPDRLAQLAPHLASLRVTRDVVNQLRPAARILHPLPVDQSVPALSEIHPDLCAEARAKMGRTTTLDWRLAWFRQADYGIPVRMALLTAILQYW